MQLRCVYTYETYGGVKLYTSTGVATHINHAGVQTKGKNIKGKYFRDVEVLDFLNGSVEYFPRGIHTTFRNLRILNIANSGLAKIERDDLIGMKHLESIYMTENQLKSLSPKFFVDKHHLKLVTVFTSELTFSGSEVLKPIMENGLKVVNMKPEANISEKISGSIVSTEDRIKIEETCLNRTSSSASTTVNPIDDSLNSDGDPDLHISSDKSFTAAVCDLWKTKKFADFTITVGSESFRVHKFVLAMNSAKLAEIFNARKEISKMSIEDAEVGIAEELLRFIYTGEIPQTTDFIKLFKISCELGVLKLKAHCEKMILRILQEPKNEELKKQAIDVPHEALTDVPLAVDPVENKEPEREEELARAQIKSTPPNKCSMINQSIHKQHHEEGYFPLILLFAAYVFLLCFGY